MRRSNNMITETWTVTQRDIKGHNCIEARKSKSAEQYMIAIFSFASTAHVTQWSDYLTERAEILTRWSNLTPRRAKNTVNDLSVAFDVKQVGFTLSSLFFAETSRLQSAVYSEWKHFCLTLQCCWILKLRIKWSHEVGLDRYLGTSIRESAKLPPY